VGLCHCLDCRKTHAAPVVAFVVFARSAVTVDAPAAALGCFESRPGHRRSFCTRCGAHVLGEMDGSDEVGPHVRGLDVPAERWLGEQPTVVCHFRTNCGERGDG
jgi:ADP-ribosyl-[dinitrogen reductase] hydrolase